MDRRFAFGPDEKEKLRTFMRMYENFSGNRILSGCFTSNPLHLLLEITPPPAGGWSDAERLARLRWIQSEAQVAVVAKELAEARKTVAAGRAKDGESHVRAIHERFTWRTHDLSQSMQEFLQRHTLCRKGLLLGAGETVEERVDRSGKMVRVADRVKEQPKNPIDSQSLIF